MSKVMSLSEAVSKFVEDGDSICFGGFTTNRKPYAAVHEILRQGQKDFIVYAGPAGGDWDMLIGEDRVKAYINCYTANSGYTNVSRRFRKKIEDGSLIFEDYSQDAIMLMLHAASLGLPYLPVRLMLGSDVADKWGITKEVRETIEKLPNDKLVELENPFVPGEKVLALPVVTDEEIRLNPSANSIPGFCVSAVVHAPHGAHPSQVYNYYDYDKEYYIAYDKASKTDEDFKAFLDEWVYGTKTHEEYLDKLGVTRLLKYKNVPGFGYATKVK